ncbi:hypothetical protein P4S95_10385 [Aneurinibacillus aneurinilyticus]|uniref:hypothetical protein n=1 Tax=Aneurinibacillus aneurinilyticus TaxID=1391 RepID=UPI002E250314|nr:hypothetical protein [Aneurinibacillus aneurinilyticus]
MATLNPELSSDERIEVIKELGLADKTKVDNGKKSTIRNGILYTLLVSEKVGVIFNAESTNKKTQ